MHNGILWILLEKFGASFLSVAVFFIYAKLLNPADMGVAVVILSVTQFLALLINAYFEDALVQKKDLTQRDIDTVFWVNIGVSLLAMILTCVGFWFWDSATTTHPVLGMAGFASIEILLTNLATTYVVQMRRKGQFKTLALRVVMGRIGGAVLGLACILSGAGAWSILVQSVTGVMFQLLILLASAKSIPKRDVHLSTLKDIHHFGTMLTLRRLSWDALVRMTPIVAGLIGGTAMAGMVGFAWRIVELPRSAVSSGLSGYLLPLLSKVQHDRNHLAKHFITITGITTFFVTPLFLGLIVVSPNLINGIFDEKWAQTAPLIQIFGFAALISCLRVPATVMMSAAGQPGKMLMTDSVFSALAILMMVTLGGLGPLIIALAHILYNLFILPKSFSIIHNLCNLTFAQQMKPILDYALAGCIMYITVVLFDRFFKLDSPLLQLCLEIITGVCIYAACSFVFHKRDILHWKSFIGRKI